MMESPDCFYNELKGKTNEEIMTEIRKLKRSMSRLKNIMENPDYLKRIVLGPSHATQIYFTREYLNKAIQAYSEAGGRYKLSKSEQQVADFDANTKAIKRLTLKIGGYCSGYQSYVVDLSNELKAYKEMWIEEIYSLKNSEGILYSKDTFIETLKELHIGEWASNYGTERFGYYILDGTQWDLKIEYNNEHKTKIIEGNNSYPYNFDELLKIFGIYEEDQEDEDDEK